MDTNSREERERGGGKGGRPTAQGVPRDTRRPGALMRKITRNKRRTGSAIIQNGYYNGPQHWLLLNPPPLPGREAAFSFANSMVRALARAHGTTGNLPEILTHPSRSSLSAGSTQPLISRDLRRQPFLYYFLQAESVGVSSTRLQFCTV